MIAYNVMTSDDGSSVITFVGHAGTRTLTDENPHYFDVRSDLEDGNDPTDWFDKVNTIIIDDARVEIDPTGKVKFQDEPVHENIGEVIMRYKREGRDTANLIKFMERLALNPSERSREMLFTWTEAKELTIDSEGFIIGYKGVGAKMLSVHSGTASVDGVEITGQIPNFVGSVITMDRAKVEDDPNKGCSYGLHVGSYQYAQTYARSGFLLEVQIDPADVVSVPRDSAFQKLRCCKYVVLAIHESNVNDISDTYEPESKFSAETIDAEVDGLDKAMPENFRTALRTRLKARFGRKSKVDDDE